MSRSAPLNMARLASVPRIAAAVIATAAAAVFCLFEPVGKKTREVWQRFSSNE
jgi:hypothetical protein